MNQALLRALVAGLGVAGAAGVARAGDVFVNADIAGSQLWTADNVYRLEQQIFVLPGATLTIQAGTVIASTTDLGGSLAVCRGAQIFVQGTQTSPVIFTSQADLATWTGGDPSTGSWRAEHSEWGNLTVMGNAYISENVTSPGVNTPAPSASNVGNMEGFVPALLGDPRTLYGGGNDDDDSGSISFLSLRYGGKVIALANELNGLSLGAIGRGTDLHHVEIMNNVDDGIEIWGGTLNLKHFAIWNIGDDSFDVDQGWRGRAQFGLIVQGYSSGAAQGSGVGDNSFETDGAEDSDWQPVTTATIYNCTVLGQPFGSSSGDHATAWRDNARVQYRNCIFMDTGDRVVSADNLDGDGAHGYGFNGTLSWADTWTTPHTATSTVNAPPNPAAFYTVQTSGNLAEIKDSVFFNNTSAAAYTEANARGVFNVANDNVQEPAGSPITSIVREAPVVLPPNNLVMARVTSLDPRPANSALTSASWAPAGGFFSSAHYRGAFAPGNNWLCGWTASEAYGITPGDRFCDLGNALAGTYGDPVLSATGTLLPGSLFTLTLSNAKENSPAVWVFGAARIDLPIYGGVLVPNFLAMPGSVISIFTNPGGSAPLSFTWPPGVPSGFVFYMQDWVLDPVAPFLFSASNALSATAP